MTKVTNHKFLMMGAVAIGLFLTGPAFADSAATDNHVVRDASGNVVYSMKFGTCVRTRWEAGTDPCAPAPREEAQAVRPQRTLESAEKTVYFDFDSSELTHEAQARLDSMAQALREAQDVRSADIVGYADRIGSTSYNTALSKQRAETVKAYLASRGYLNTRVAEVRGLGEAHPVSNCNREESRAKLINCLSPDRRVEVEIQYLDTPKTAYRN